MSSENASWHVRIKGYYYQKLLSKECLSIINNCKYEYEIMNIEFWIKIYLRIWTGWNQ